MFGHDLSRSYVSKSNRLHVDIVRFFFINLKYNLYIFLKWSVIFLKSWTSTGYFSNSTGSSVTSGWFSPFIPGIAGCWQNNLVFTINAYIQDQHCTTFATWCKLKVNRDPTPNLKTHHQLSCPDIIYWSCTISDLVTEFTTDA